MKELKIINLNLYFFGLVLFHFTGEVYLQNVYYIKGFWPSNSSHT